VIVFNILHNLLAIGDSSHIARTGVKEPGEIILPPPHDDLLHDAIEAEVLEEIRRLAFLTDGFAR
jgi:hypothetical protein